MWMWRPMLNIGPHLLLFWCLYWRLGISGVWTPPLIVWILVTTHLLHLGSFVCLLLLCLPDLIDFTSHVETWAATSQESQCSFHTPFLRWLLQHSTTSLDTAVTLSQALATVFLGQQHWHSSGFNNTRLWSSDYLLSLGSPPCSALLPTVQQKASSLGLNVKAVPVTVSQLMVSISFWVGMCVRMCVCACMHV